MRKKRRARRSIVTGAPPEKRGGALVSTIHRNRQEAQ
jgi:hypothetical protein